MSNGSTTRKPYAELRRRQLRHGGTRSAKAPRAARRPGHFGPLRRPQGSARRGSWRDRSLREDLGRAASVSDSVVDEFKKEINEAAALKSNSRK